MPQLKTGAALRVVVVRAARDRAVSVEDQRTRARRHREHRTARRIPCHLDVSVIYARSVMTPRLELRVSKTQVNRAGELIRDFVAHVRAETTDAFMQTHTVEEINAADEIVRHFRACHQGPLTSATMGLRSMVITEGCSLEVTQRLKRYGTMIDKLQRQPAMNLSRMQDVGGCRAVLNSVDEINRVTRRLRRNGRAQRVVDYIAAPAESGYRGVHVITEYHERSIEVQLRTQIQHAWAISVERVGGRLREDLKSGSGPPELLQFFGVASEGMAMEEAGITPTLEFLAKFDSVRKAAAPWLVSRKGGGG
jgi:putative GTP pyrophosphokinase